MPMGQCQGMWGCCFPREPGLSPKENLCPSQVMWLLSDFISCASQWEKHHLMYWPDETVSKKVCNPCCLSANAAAEHGEGDALMLPARSPGWSPSRSRSRSGRPGRGSQSGVGWEEPGKRQGLPGIGSCQPAGRWSPKWATPGSALWICTLTLPSPADLRRWLFMTLDPQKGWVSS